MQTILLEDIRNYSIVKKELLDTYNNKFELKYMVYLKLVIRECDEF